MTWEMLGHYIFKVLFSKKHNHTAVVPFEIKSCNVFASYVHAGLK